MAMINDVQLSEKQQRKAIKKKPQKAFKNVLADPFSKFWPEINAQERIKLSEVLATILPNDVPSEEVPAKNRKLKHESIVLGLGNLVRKINQGTLEAAIFSANLEPKFITRQIMTLSLSKKGDIILLVVPSLEDITESVFGVKSYTMGLSAVGDTEDDLLDIRKTLREIFGRFKVPVRVKFSSRNQTITASDSKPKRRKPEPLIENIDFNTLYLKRVSPDKKAWSPTNNLDKIRNEETKSDKATVKKWTDFISLGGDADNDDDVDMDDQQGEIDMDEERIRLKELLLGTGNVLPEVSQKMESDAEDQEEEVNQATETPSQPPSVFLKPEETSGNQWGDLLKPENLARNLTKQQKRQEKRQRRKEKKSNPEVPFHPMKVHKIQPNPRKAKNKKLKKTKK